MMFIITLTQNDHWQVIFSIEKNSRNFGSFTNRYLKSNSLHIFPSERQAISRTAIQYEREIIRKGTEMLKKIRTEFRAAIILIATENISALRVLFKNILGFASKSVHLHRKS